MIVQLDGLGTAEAEIGQSFGEMTVFVVAAPYSCPEWFSAFLSMSAAGRNDFETGLNIDQAASTAPRFEIVNVESAGAGGVGDLEQLLELGFELRDGLFEVEVVARQGGHSDVFSSRAGSAKAAETRRVAAVRQADEPAAPLPEAPIPA